MADNDDKKFVFVQPEPYVPDHVQGDTLDEVQAVDPFQPPPGFVPHNPEFVFAQPDAFVPNDNPSALDPVPSHDPFPVNTPFVEPDHNLPIDIQDSQPNDTSNPVTPIIRGQIDSARNSVITLDGGFVEPTHHVPRDVIDNNPADTSLPSSAGVGADIQRARAAIPPFSPVIDQIRAEVNVTRNPADLRQEAEDRVLRLRAQDERIKNIFAGIDNNGLNPLSRGPYTPYGGTGPGTQSWNPLLYAKFLVNLGSNLKSKGLNFFPGPGGDALAVATGFGRFIAEQSVLFALNRDPETRSYRADNILIQGVPVIRELTPLFNSDQGVDDKPGFYAKRVQDGFDRHAQWRQGNLNSVTTYPAPPFLKAETMVGAAGPQNALNIAEPRGVGARSQDASLVNTTEMYSAQNTGIPLVDIALQKRNLYYGDNDIDIQRGSDTHSPVNVSDLIDAVLDETGPALDLMEQDLLTERKKFSPLAKIFQGHKNSLNEFRPVANVARDRGQPVVRGKLERAAFPGGIVPVSIRGERDDGTVLTRYDRERGEVESPTNVVDDDDAYVPLSFTDIRPDTQAKIRTVYFRPFITSLVEDYSVDWQKNSYIGRVDPVAIYGSTVRTISLGFDVHAFSPEDVRIMYKKLNWLNSMVYPEFFGPGSKRSSNEPSLDMLFKSAPVVRLRVGDVVKGSNQLGLTGIIESLNVDYTDNLWELKKDFKVPRAFKVNVNFTVLHDALIGRFENGLFGAVRVDGDTGKPIYVGSAPFRGFQEIEEEREIGDFENSTNFADNVG